MPLSPLQQILAADKLSEGRVKLNNSLEALRLFANSLETANDNLVPEDIQNLIIGGKINPAYLDTYLASVGASDVSVDDLAGYFTGTNVEEILAELYLLIDAIVVGDGTVWHSGVGVPASGLGVVDDFYLDTATQFVYKKTGAATWTFQFSMKGADGADGADGLSAYEVAVANGFVGTELNWLDSLVGADGADGSGGDVVGPASSVTSNFPSFSDTTGKLIQDSGFSSASFATAAQGTAADNAVPNTRTVTVANSLSGGGALSSNISISLVGDEPSPGVNQVYGTDGAGSKGWKPDPAGTGAGDVVGPASSLDSTIVLFDGTTGKIVKDSGNLVSSLVPSSRTVSTESSITGGGALSGDLTLSLENDEVTPLANYVYGTNGAGARGWKPDPVTPTTTTVVTTNRTITNTDNNTVLLCTSPVIITLPDSLDDNVQFSVLNVSSGVVSFSASGTSVLLPVSVILDNSSGADITVASVMHHTGGDWYLISSATGDIQSFTVMLSDMTTDLTTGAGKASYRIPYGFYVSEVRAFVSSAPTGTALLTVDINETGTSILSTRLTFDSGEKTTTTAVTPAVISDNLLADDSELTFDVDIIGDTNAGRGLGVTIIGYRV